MRTHSRLATDNRRQDTVHRRANNAVEKLLTLAALTKLLFVCLLGGHVRVSGDLRRLTLIVTMQTNRLQCQPSQRHLEYLLSFEPRRHSAANPPERAKPDGCELGTRRKLASLRLR